jgi:hypothetical protein
VARLNMRDKVERRRKGALARFKIKESRKGIQSIEERILELQRLKEKVSRYR